MYLGSVLENSVSISRNNLASLQQAPYELLHLIISGIETDTVDDLLQEDQDLLVGESVERPAKPHMPAQEDR